MPTARELLEQADALMRRNRDSGHDDVPLLTEVVPGAPEPDEVVPVLTVVVEAGQSESSTIDIDADLAAMGPEFPTVKADVGYTMPLPAAEPTISIGGVERHLPMLEIPPEKHHYQLDPVRVASPNGIANPAPKVNSGISGDMLAKTLPLSELLTVPAAKPIEAQFFDVPPGTSIAPPKATPGGSVPNARPPAPEDFVSPPTHVVSPPDAAVSAPVAPTMAEPPRPLDLQAQAQDLTEQITLQVLQKLDIYTERGLQEHLLQHLKPVVERAVSELVATINANVGRVIRAFVAESIEKEIEGYRAKILEAMQRAHRQD